ncbi:DUF4907 domain-containing protein [Robertkochia solimangrovi]|uniref:DUF4907 domain-containing protein n=1 Tax=Robertkochia solimangrovi TaxID=2213046 RepID=UPI00117CB494|nr:DUF4907 domain-containing protein [Robertkochia solimangrovi]TRZ41868.1 hypothetical protein DMZ48_16115 [Robertkochia solimangrovi]
MKKLKRSSGFVGPIAVLIASIAILWALGILLTKEPGFNLKLDEDQSGWSYSVFFHEKLMIKQRYVPGVSGTYKFENKEGAEAIGMLVIHRLQEKTNPRITAADLTGMRIKIRRVALLGTD